MAERLGEPEMAALLAAVERGQVDLAEPAGVPGVVPYDFRRPERVIKEHIRALQTLHEGFARNLGASLSTFMRTIVETRIASVEQSTYGEFIASLPNPTCFYLLAVQPLDGNLILELNPSIAFPMLDRLLGGGREPAHIPQRPVTDIEQRLIDRLVDRALKGLAEAWSAVQAINVSVLQKETNPHLIQVFAAGEVVVLVTLEIAVSGASGMLNLCLPFAVIEPMLNRIVRVGRSDRQERTLDGHNADRIARLLGRAPMRVTAYLARTAITVGDLLGLAVGDVLRTEKPAEATLLVTVEGRPKFRGRPAQHRGKKAVVITGPAAADDPI